jgi:hypothetical protein
MRQMDQGEGGARTWGGQGRAGRTGPSWAGLGWATLRIETHDTHDH